jgi:hypothetical protein
VINLVPADVLLECREKAASTMRAGKPKNLAAGGIIILIWVGLFGFTFYFLSGMFMSR